jgi:hypothetical protein
MQKKNWFVVALLFLLTCATAQAQQPQPLTFWSDYTVKPGKEEDFMNIVKAVGQPVRDKLMAEGVVLAWGIEVPLLRGVYPSTHTIWYAVADWSGIEKVQSAMNAQLARVAADEAKAAEDARKKGQRTGPTTAERIRDILEMDKTRDWLTRDLVFAVTNQPVAAGTLPFTRYNGIKVKPGQGGAYRAAWEKYNKPVYDKLLADGAILAFGLGVEDLRTEGSWTHFVWVAAKDMSAFEKTRNAFAADRARRSEEERNAIAALFNSLTDADASRSSVSRSIVFRLPGMK